MEEKTITPAQEFTSCAITVSENRDSRIETILFNVSKELRNAINTLEDIWQEIGIKEEQREKRNHTVFSLLQGYLKDMVADEEDLKKQLQESIQRCRQDLQELCTGLGLPSYEPDTNLTLLQLEASLRTRADELHKEKHERLKNLRTLRTEEEKLCNRLVLPQFELNFVGCPTLEQLKELEQNIKFLNAEKDKRFGLFKKLQAKILKFWEDLEMDPYTDFETQVCQPDADEMFILSAENLDRLRDLEQNLEQEHRQLLGEIDGLKEKVKALWQRLEIGQKEQDAFNNKNAGYTPKVAKELKKELSRLEELKKQHMQKFVEALRKELAILWDKCHYGKEQRQEFRPFYEAIFTDEALSLHEHQVQVMGNYFKENEHIFVKVEKRESVWKKKIEFENRPTDANRLNNRGGALLKEEKLRKAIEKELPKLESELKKILTDWEKDQQAYFLFDGVRYLDRIENDHKHFERKREDKKMERQRAKKENLKTELAFGSKPTTPSKSLKRVAVNTPGKTPKFRKLDVTATPSKFIHSSILPSPVRAVKPNQSMKKPQGTVRAGKVQKLKVKSKTVEKKRRSQRLSAQRRILSDQNQTLNTPVSKTKFSSPKLSVISGSMLTKPNASKDVSIISYTDFQGGLGSPSCISSFLETTPQANKV